MKKFLLHITLFLSALIAGVVVLFVLPVDRKYAYSFLSKGGCQGRAPWIYQRIYEDSTNIDMAFIGTSHTMNAINDKRIEAYLRDSANMHVNCRNLSFCGFGRDLDYIFIKDLLQHKHVKTLVLEVRENESPFGHQSFPYVAASSDVFSAPMYFSRSYLPGIYKSLLFRLQYLREMITGEDKKRAAEISLSPYGFSVNHSGISETELEQARQRATTRRKKQIAIVESTLRYAQTEYVNRIAQLAKEKNVKLMLVYLPSYSGQLGVDEIQQRYEAWAPVIYDDTLNGDKSKWADKEHLNNEGAAIMSRRIAEALRSI